MPGPAITSEGLLQLLEGATKPALLCWISYEDRSLSCLRDLSANSTLGLYFFHYGDAEYEIKARLREARVLSGSRLRKTTVSERANQYFTNEGFQKFVREAASTHDRVFIDISCFPREALLMLLNVLFRSAHHHCEFFFVYNIATDYSVNETDPNNKWLGRGVRRVGPVLGFPGRMIPGRSLAVIGLAGMDEERFVSLVDEMEPEELHVGIGVSSETHKAWMTTRTVEIAEKLKGKILFTSQFTFDCELLGATLNSITAEYEQITGRNVALVTLNNKISTIAAGLFALGNRAVQICSAPAIIYNSAAYSRPSENYLVFRVREVLGHVDAAKELIVA